MLIRKKRGIVMIKITLKNGDTCIWKSGEFTDYKYDGKCFIVIKDKEWIGLYNIDSIVSVIIN